MPKWDFARDPGLSAPHFEGQEVERAMSALFVRAYGAGRTRDPSGRVTHSALRKHFGDEVRAVLSAVFPGATFYEPPAPEPDVP